MKYFATTLIVLFCAAILSANALAQASATWQMNAASAAAAVTVGEVTATAEGVIGLEYNNTSTIGGTTGGRLRGAGNTWPTGQLDTIGSKYLEFKISPTAGNSLTVASVSVNLWAASSGNIRVSIFYSIDGFLTATKILDGNAQGSLPQAAPVLFFTNNPNVIVNDGGTFTLRLYPWLNNQTSLTGKYFIADSLVISGSTVAPVELTSFTASATKTGATLAWKTATETNCFGYAIERRAVGTTASLKVGFVKGAGTSSIAHEYSFTDANVLPGRYVYSIVQQDNDGTSKTYSAAEIQLGVAPMELSATNYPNPFNPSTQIVFSVPQSGRVVVKVFNILGQLIETAFDGQATAGQYTHAQFDGTRHSSGIYYYSVEFNGQRMVKRMTIVK